MPNPQQPELRRSAKGATTQDSTEVNLDASSTPGAGGHAHGTDKGNRGGGRGGGVPPEQQPDHPV